MFAVLELNKYFRRSKINLFRVCSSLNNEQPSLQNETSRQNKTQNRVFFSKHTREFNIIFHEPRANDLRYPLREHKCLFTGLLSMSKKAGFGHLQLVFLTG